MLLRQQVAPVAADPAVRAAVHRADRAVVEVAAGIFEWVAVVEAGGRRRRSGRRARTRRKAQRRLHGQQRVLRQRANRVHFSLYDQYSTSAFDARSPMRSLA